MKKLFSTPVETSYTLATIIVIAMITFPPVYQQLDGGYLYFRGYKFIFWYDYVIDISRLLLQFVALGAVVITIKRIIGKR